MKLQLKFAFKDIKKNFGLVLLFTIQLFIAFIYVTNVTDQLMQSSQADNYRKSIFNGKSVSFHLFRNGLTALSTDPNLDSLLSKTLDGRSDAYSFVGHAHLSDAPPDGSGINIVVGFGKFGSLFNLEPKGKSKTSAKTVVLLGSNVKKYAVGDQIKIGTFSIDPLKISGVLHPGAVYLNADGIQNIDDSIVILTTWDDWKKYDTADYTSDIFSNVTFSDIGANDGRASKFAQAVSRLSQKYDLVPYDSGNVNTQKLEMAQGEAVFLLFFIGILILIAVGVISSAAQLVDRNFREYVIHYLYGATKRDLYLRTVLFCAILFLIPFCLAVAAIMTFPFTYANGTFYIFAASAAILIAATSAYPVIRLKNQDMTGFLRRDN